MMRKYDDEFKRQAVKKILDGQSVASVSRELGVAEGIRVRVKCCGNDFIAFLVFASFPYFF
jgi:transposase-like protein